MGGGSGANGIDDRMNNNQFGFNGVLSGLQSGSDGNIIGVLLEDSKYFRIEDK